ncbi:hypothetical protein GMA83_13120 [Turicibacter sanguinis]|nr:hypothetical protein [Turicibacter sanguinis]
MKLMIILGYLTDGTDWKVDDVDLGSLTHINYAFATVKDTSGEVHENWNRAIQVKDLKANFPHLKVCVSIGGWGASNFSEAAETQESRELFSKSSIEIMQKYSMDGIDIDWEYPTIPGGGISCHPDDKKNFTLLLKQVRQDLDELSKRTNQDYLLTIAAGASLSYLRAVEMEELNQILDYVNIMTYDMGGSFHVTGHHTNIYPSCLTEKYGETYYPGGAYFIEQFIKLGMNVEKLVAGIEEGFNEYWDDLAKAPWAYNGDTFITYENEKSVAEKMKYVKEKGLLGVMFWEYQTDQTKTLLNVIHENK